MTTAPTSTLQGQPSSSAEGSSLRMTVAVVGAACSRRPERNSELQQESEPLVCDGSFTNDVNSVRSTWSHLSAVWMQGGKSRRIETGETLWTGRPPGQQPDPHRCSGYPQRTQGTQFPLLPTAPAVDASAVVAAGIRRPVNGRRIDPKTDRPGIPTPTL